jgi:hypothetical protein
VVVREDGVECVVVWRLETKGWEPQMNTDEHEWGGSLGIEALFGNDIKKIRCRSVGAVSRRRTHWAKQSSKGSE